MCEARKSEIRMSKSKTNPKCEIRNGGIARLLEEFERLPHDAQREFSDVILHRTAHFDYDDPSDEELTVAARAMFAVLDREGAHQPSVSYDQQTTRQT